MKHFIYLSFLFVLNVGFTQDLRTTFSKDFSRWDYDDFSFNTAFIKSYDNWKCGGETIRTVFLNDWDSWRIGSEVTLKTTFSNDFDDWTIQGHGKTIKVKTAFMNSLDQWRITGDFEGSFRTTFTDDWERWDFDVDFGSLEYDLQKAIVFIAVYTSFSQNTTK